MFAVRAQQAVNAGSLCAEHVMQEPSTPSLQPDQASALHHDNLDIPHRASLYSRQGLMHPIWLCAKTLSQAIRTKWHAKMPRDERSSLLACVQFSISYFNSCSKTQELQRLAPVTAGIAAAQWLALRLQAVAAVLVTLVALLAVLGHEHLLPFATGSSKFAASKLP